MAADFWKSDFWAEEEDETPFEKFLKRSGGMKATISGTPKRGFGYGENNSGDRAISQYDGNLELAQAAGVEDDGKAPGGFLMDALNFIDKPRAFIQSTIEEGVDLVTDDDASWSDWTKNIGENKNLSDTEFLSKDDDDSRRMKAAKMAGSFVGDVLLDPVTYLTFGAGGLAKKGTQEALEAAAPKLFDDAAKQMDGDAVESMVDRFAKQSRPERLKAFLDEKVPSAKTDEIDLGNEALKGLDKTHRVTLAKESFGHALAEAHVKGNATGVRSFMRDTFGKTQGDELFDSLPAELKGGVRFRAPFVKDENGLNRTWNLTSGGGKTFEKLGLAKLDGGEVQGVAGKVNDWRSTLRTSKPVSAVARNFTGAHGERYDAAIKSIREGNKDIAAVGYSEYALYRDMYRDVAKYKGTLTKTTIEAMQQVAAYKKQHKDNPRFDQQYRYYFQNPEKITAANLDALSEVDKAAAAAAQTVHDQMRMFSEQIQKELGPDVNLIDNGYVRRMLTEERAEDMKRGKILGGRGKGGGASPLKSRQAFAEYGIDPETGVYRVKRWHTLDEANQKMVEVDGKDMFETDPTTIFTEYAGTMSKVLTRARVRNRMTGLGLMVKMAPDTTVNLNIGAAQDFIAGETKRRFGENGESAWNDTAIETERKKQGYFDSKRARFTREDDRIKAWDEQNAANDLARQAAAEAAAKHAAEENARLAAEPALSKLLAERDNMLARAEGLDPVEHSHLAEARARELNEQLAQRGDPVAIASQRREALLDQRYQALQAGDTQAVQALDASVRDFDTFIADTIRPEQELIDSIGQLNLLLADINIEDAVREALEKRLKMYGQALDARAWRRSQPEHVRVEPETGSPWNEVPIGERPVVDDEARAAFAREEKEWADNLADLERAAALLRSSDEALRQYAHAATRVPKEEAGEWYEDLMRLLTEYDTVELSRAYRRLNAATDPEQQAKIQARIDAIRRNQEKRAMAKHSVLTATDEMGASDTAFRDAGFEQLLEKPKSGNLSASEAENWAEYLAPTMLREAAQQYFTANNLPEPIQAFADSVYRPWYSLAKAHMTVSALRGPGYHVRNLIGGMWNNFLGNVTAHDHLLSAKLVNAKHVAVRDARKELGENASKTDVDARAVEMLRANKELMGIKVGKHTLGEIYESIETQQLFANSRLLEVFDTDSMTDARSVLDGNMNLFRRKERDELNKVERGANWLMNNKSMRGFDRDGKLWLVPLGGTAAEVSEEYLRTAAFIAGTRRFGLGEKADGRAAAMFTKALHFDYGQEGLSQTESWMKNILPFYVWSRNNIPLQFRGLMTEPGKMMKVYHLNEAAKDMFGNEDERWDEYLPEWVGERMGWATDVEVNGSPITVAPDLPMMDLNKWIATNPLKTPEKAWGEAKAAFNPAIKVGVENITKTDSFTGAKWTNKDAPNWAKLPGVESLIAGDVNADGEQIANQRAVSTLRNLVPILGTVEKAPIGQPESASGRNLTSWASWSGLQGPLSTSTLTEDQIAGELARRNERLDEILDDWVGRNKIDPEWVRMVKSEDWTDEEIVSALKAGYGLL